MGIFFHWKQQKNETSWKHFYFLENFVFSLRLNNQNKCNNRLTTSHDERNQVKFKIVEIPWETSERRSARNSICLLKVTKFNWINWWRKVERTHFERDSCPTNLFSIFLTSAKHFKSYLLFKQLNYNFDICKNHLSWKAETHVFKYISFL